jgi:hypothetical protein
MINLTGGALQGPDNSPVANGSITFQLNTDAHVVATGGIVPRSIPVTFQLDDNGDIVQPAQIYSNLELSPQEGGGNFLGTLYEVTVEDANGARLNARPYLWIFNQSANSTVSISDMTAYLVEGV